MQEFEIWTKPYRITAADFGKQFAAPKLRGDLGVSEDVAKGIESKPSHVDVTNLELALNERELFESDFEEFCLSHKFKNATADTESAHAFLNFSYGSPVLWLHLPETEEGNAILLTMVEWAKENDLCLVDPFLLCCLI